MEKKNQQTIPTEHLDLNVLKAPTLYRRLRQTKTRVNQPIVQLPLEVLNPSTDIGTNKKFLIQLSFDSEGKRIVLVHLDRFVFPDLKNISNSLGGGQSGK